MDHGELGAGAVAGVSPRGGAERKSGGGRAALPPPREGLGYKGTEVVGDDGRIWGCSRGVGGVAET